MSTRSSSDFKTLPIAVANTGFMLDRLGMDCDPLQFLRELTQNSIESILRTPSKSGEIVWDVDWLEYDLQQLWKLSITDNGDGMTGEEMVKYINHLSSSSGIQSYIANFGVGAKIAAATRNHAGLLYLSWKNGIGSHIWLWKDPQTGDYGLRQIERPDGTYGHWAHIDNEVRPELMQDHGTKVVLYGMTMDENTMQAPAGTPSPSRWVTRYLNTRYFRFPDGITIKCREGWENDRSDKDRNLLRTILGQKAYLDDHAKSSGIVELTSARVHWWLLKQEGALTQNSGFINSAGHCAALWKDELYETTSGRANTAALQGFGIVFGYQQVVLYVEPRSVPGIDVYTNTARTALLMNGRPLPWAEWQDEFKKEIPEAIVEHMETVASAADKSDHSASIKERLKQVQDLYNLSRYRPTKAGTLLIGGDSRALGGSERTGEREAMTRESGGSKVPGKTPSAYALFLSANGVPGERVSPDVFPEIKWISVADGTRTAGDLEDRAARFLEKENLLLINTDFRVFADMNKRYEAMYSGVPGAKSVIEEVVREWFEQSLVEVVLSSNALRDAQHWSIQQIEALLSDEGLTCAVLPRYHIDQSIKRTLGVKLGSLKQKAA